VYGPYVLAVAVAAAAAFLLSIGTASCVAIWIGCVVRGCGAVATSYDRNGEYSPVKIDQKIQN
jgi:predicted DNA repair protein MutK